MRYRNAFRFKEWELLVTLALVQFVCVLVLSTGYFPELSALSSWSSYKSAGVARLFQVAQGNVYCALMGAFRIAG
jgi:hypothetical protein